MLLLHQFDPQFSGRTLERNKIPCLFSLALLPQWYWAVTALAELHIYNVLCCVIYMVSPFRESVQTQNLIFSPFPFCKFFSVWNVATVNNISYRYFGNFLANKFLYCQQFPRMSGKQYCRCRRGKHNKNNKKKFKENLDFALSCSS